MSQSWRHSPSKRLLRSSIKPVWWLSWYQSAQVTNEQNQGCLRYLGDEDLTVLLVVGFILSHYRNLGIPIKKPGFNGRKFDKTQPESGVLYFLGFAKYQRGWSLAFPPAICLWNGERFGDGRIGNGLSIEAVELFLPEVNRKRMAMFCSE